MNKKLLIGFVFLFLISLTSVSALLTDGLISYYSFDDGGTDSLGRNNLTTTGATLGLGKVNNASLYTASGNRFTLTTGVNLPFNNSVTGFTMCAWVNSTNSSAYQRVIILSDSTTSGKMGFQYRSDPSTGLQFWYNPRTGERVTTTSFQRQVGWGFVCGIANSSGQYGFINGTYYNSTTYNSNSTTITKILLGQDSDATTEQFLGMIDELGIWNRTLTNSEMLSLYNTGNGLPYPFIGSIDNITFYSQSPLNITDISLFSGNANFTYNYSIINLTSPLLNYSVYGGSSCLQILNGTCIKLNNTFTTKAQSSNVTSGNYSLISFELGENDIYNFVEFLNYTSFNTPHSVYSSSNINHYVSLGYLNITNASYQIFEVMANVSVGGSARLITCNSSYVSGDVRTSPYCFQFATLTEQSFNHSHNANQYHQVKGYTVINNRVNGLTLGVTNEMSYYIVPNVGTTFVYYVPTVTRANTIRTTTSNGVVWNNEAYTVDSHIHFYSGSDYLTYQAQGVFNGTFYNTSFTIELIDVAPLLPSPPTITHPFNTTQATRYMNITYTNGSSNVPGGSINRYNISLLNNDLTFNRTIVANNSVNLFYYWDVYAQNLSIKDYYVQVCAIDNLNQFSCDFQWFNLTRNAEINVSLYNYTGSLITPSKTIYFNGLNDSISDNTSSTILNVIRGNSYSIIIDSTPTYAFNRFNSTASIFVNYVNRTLYPSRSLNVSIYDTLTQSLITQNITVVITSSYNATTYYITSGSYIFVNLPIDTIEVKLSSVNFSESRYSVDIADNETYSLNTYLTSSGLTSNVTFTIFNTYGAIVENVYVKQYVLSNSSYLLTMNDYTDISGKVYFTFNTNYYYLYEISHPSYTSYSFVLEPPRESNYDITIYPSSYGVSYSLINITGSHTFSNATNILAFSYVSSEVNRTYDFWVYFKGIKICSNSSSTLSNTFYCNLTGYSGLVYIYGVSDNFVFYGSSEIIGSDNLSDYISLEEASFWSGIVLLLVMIIGATLGIVVSIVFGVVALVVILLLGLFSPLSLSIVAISVVIGIIIGVVIRRQR